MARVSAAAVGRMSSSGETTRDTDIGSDATVVGGFAFLAAPALSYPKSSNSDAIDAMVPANLRYARDGEQD